MGQPVLFSNANPISFSDPLFLSQCLLSSAPVKLLHSRWCRWLTKSWAILSLDSCTNFRHPRQTFPYLQEGGASALSRSCLRIYLCMVGHAFHSKACNGMQQGTHVNFRLIDALNFSFNILHRGHLQVGGFFVNHKPVHFKDIGVEISYQGTVFLTFSLVIRYQTVIFSCYS